MNVTPQRLKAVVIENRYVDYIITEGGHYVAFAKEKNKTLGNILPKGLDADGVSSFMRQNQPLWATCAMPDGACAVTNKNR